MKMKTFFYEIIISFNVLKMNIFSQKNKKIYKYLFSSENSWKISLFSSESTIVKNNVFEEKIVLKISTYNPFLDENSTYNVF